jgi:hypothetical protein
MSSVTLVIGNLDIFSFDRIYIIILPRYGLVQVICRNITTNKAYNLQLNDLNLDSIVKGHIENMNETFSLFYSIFKEIMSI